MDAEELFSLPITERHVQAIWYDQSLRPPSMRTSDGATIEVIDPGTWNLEHGPDFLGATLQINGLRTRGDVEIHLKPSDWSVHGHADDPAYAHVTVHVTWYEGNIPTTLPRGCRSVALAPVLRTKPDFSPAAIDVTAYPFAKLPESARPCELRFRDDTDGALDLLLAAGRERIMQKSHRIAQALIRGRDRRQTFYEETMAAMGCKANAPQMREIAMRLRHESMSDNPHIALLSLMSVAGLVEWDRRGTRPANTPTRRLEAAAQLFAGRDPLNEIDRCDLSTQGGIKQAMEILSAPTLGARRGAVIMANVVIPFAIAEKQIKEVPAKLPPEDISSPMRIAAFRLLGRDHNPGLYANNGVMLQGLIHIHRTFCLVAHPDCGRCPLAPKP